MFSERLQSALNDQVNYEFYSAHLYLAAAAFCLAIDLDGFSNFFKVQAEEEKFHAMKLFDFVSQMDGRVLLKGIPEVENSYESIFEVVEKSAAHERIVTKRIYNLSDIAFEEKEHATISLLRWFIDEQVEEESNFNTLIKKLKRIEHNTAALYMLDNELASRVFIPPVGNV